MKKLVLIIFLTTLSTLKAQVGINTPNPHVSAELDISSTSKGLLVPRLTTSAINLLSATASEGLIVFDTNKKIFLGWDGTKWQIFGNTNNSLVSYANWEVGGLPGGANNFGPSPFAGTINQITSASLVRGSGLNSTTTGATGAWGGNGFDNLTLANAITNGDYATITLSLPSTAGYSFVKIAAHNFRRSTTGPTSAQWQYSIDGTTFINIGTPIALGSTAGAGNNVSEIPLDSYYDLQNISNITVTFRIVGYGGTGGTWYINNTTGNDLDFIGTVE